MLVYTNTWVLGTDITSQWSTEANILELPMTLVLRKCSKVYIEFQDNETQQYCYYDLAQAGLDTLSTYENISAFLNYGEGYINNETLVSSFNNGEYHLVNYFNMFAANYEAKLNNNFQNTNILNPPETYNNDLLLVNNHYAISNSYVDNNCLITINGFLHNFFINDNDEIEVINGGNTFLNLLNSQVGLLNFSNIGTLTRIPILVSDILTINNLYSNIQLNIPTSFDPSTQTLMLSIGGYLTVLDGINVFIDDNNILNINLSGLNFINRYIESSLYLNLDNLIYENEVVYFKTYGEGTDGGEIYNVDTGTFDGAVTNQLILNYIANTPCFFIIINNPSVSSNSYYPQVSNFPGQLKIDIEPLYPFITYTGRIIEYGYEKHLKGYKITVLDEILKHVMFVGANNSSNNTFYGNWMCTDYQCDNRALTSTASFLRIYTQD